VGRGVQSLLHTMAAPSPTMALGSVRLTVADLAGARAFYEYRRAERHVRPASATPQPTRSRPSAWISPER
jgi:hypothetical protein